MPSEFERAADALLFTEELSFKTRGWSMRPLFVEHRDIVNIRTVKRRLKRGDVVLYPSKSGNALVLHRIIRIKGDDLLIRGDNNYFNEYRKKDEVVGIMTSFFRDGKYCDVKKSLWYKLYSFYILNSYFLRKNWVGKIKPAISKFKAFILKIIKTD